MRYPDGGGLDAGQRAARERLRFLAAERLAQGVGDSQIARELRVTTVSVGRWRRAWQAGGTDALVSKGAGGAACRLTPDQLEQLQVQLRAGPAVHGWDDQRWTLTRIAELIRRLFGVSYSLGGLCLLMHRLGWSVQAPARRAAERDEAQIRTWCDEVWREVKPLRRS